VAYNENKSFSIFDQINDDEKQEYVVRKKPMQLKFDTYKMNINQQTTKAYRILEIQ
jgi:hypothetical protein